MKNLRIVVIGCLFIVGIPWALFVLGWSIPVLLEDAFSLRQMMDAELLVQVFSGLTLWLVWAFGVASVVYEFFYRARGGTTHSSDRLVSHAAAAFVLALWVLVVQPRPMATSTDGGEPATSVVLAASQDEILPKHDQRISTSFALTALLAVYELKIQRKLQRSNQGMNQIPISKSSQMLLSSLKYLRATREALPVTLIGNRERHQGDVYVPIGISEGKILLISLCHDDRILVQSDSESETDVVRQYLSCVIEAHDLDPTSVLSASEEAATIRIRQTSDHWIVDPTKCSFKPFWLTHYDAQKLTVLNRELQRPFRTESVDGFHLGLDDWKICVRLMGPLEVADRQWQTINFEKSKSAELLAWLVLHRDRPTRIAARTALWEMSVQDATFNNVISGVRRAINLDDQTLLTRGTKDVLRIRPEVVTDYDILQQSIQNARHVADDQSFSDVKMALELVRDLPFAGQDFVWADTEGITSNIVLTIVTGALMLAEHSMNKGDIDGVFWATGQGLKALRGHEALIALRMKAHAQQRNISGINAEWQAYERLRVAEDHFLDRKENELAKLREALLTSA
jgi:hypothetical protein